MSSPVVAGVAAVYLQRFPGSNPKAVKNALVNTGTPNVVFNIPDAATPNVLLFAVKGAAPTTATGINGDRLLEGASGIRSSRYDSQVATLSGMVQLGDATLYGVSLLQAMAALAVLSLLFGAAYLLVRMQAKVEAMW